MDPQTFSDSLLKSAAKLIAELYYVADLPRDHVIQNNKYYTEFLNQHAVITLFNQLIDRMISLGETPDNDAAYRTMLKRLQKPFESLESEYACLGYLEKTGSYIPPQEKFIDVDENKPEEIEYELEERDEQKKTKKVSLQFFPLRQILRQFFELPKMYHNTKIYLEQLEKQKKLVTNIVQGDFWDKRIDKREMKFFLFFCVEKVR